MWYTGLDLTAATNQYIKYELEGGTTGQITGSKSSQSVVGTIPKDTTLVGKLWYQPYVSWDSGTTYYHGDKKVVDIERKITVTT